jgi:hypothetical protein
MKITLTVEGTEQLIDVQAKPFSIRLKDGAFCVTTPMHDDWLQTMDFDLRKAAAVIHWHGCKLAICFPTAEARSQFQTWLFEANSKAEHGYKTMYP